MILNKIVRLENLDEDYTRPSLPGWTLELSK